MSQPWMGMLLGMLTDHPSSWGKINHGEKRGANSPSVKRGAPSHVAHKTDGVPSIWDTLRQQGIHANAADIIIASWKPCTGKQYHPHIRRWSQFCIRGNICPLAPSLANIINVLRETFHRNVGYESVNTARGALSSLGIVVVGCRAGCHPTILNHVMQRHGM